MGEITSFMSKGIPPKYVERENENTVRVLNQKCNRNFETIMRNQDYMTVKKEKCQMIKCFDQEMC